MIVGYFRKLPAGNTQNAFSYVAEQVTPQIIVNGMRQVLVQYDNDKECVEENAKAQNGFVYVNFYDGS
jgi:hypothetical protein